MSTALTIGGGALQTVGLVLVFVELAVIRSFEFAVPSPWARAADRVRRLLRRPRIVHVSAADSIKVSDAARATVRPGAPAEDASEAHRIARLERYVEYLNRDVEDLHQTIDRRTRELERTTEQRARELRDEMDRRDEQRRQAVRPSLRRQGAGAVCATVGTILATIGGV